ncbi:MAG: Ldh family oxidoreductase, partial [Acidobacteria bacterium]|nr:Ldh family oxidoreductase [Acidobacteriota bacterium]
MSSRQVTLDAGALTGFMQALFTASGVRDEWAALVAESLVAANLRGVDSHGVQLAPFYLSQLADGRVDAQAAGRVALEAGALLNYDGENGLGQVVASHAVDHAARLAGEHGLGLVVARESNHFGAAAWWAQRLSARGLLGIVLCNASTIVPPWQAKDPVWGTNPICVSPPGGRWLLDMATTTVAMGKIYKAKVSGEAEIPPGWAMDSEGRPTTSTADALAGLLMPLSGYKGSGLAMMVEILTGVLAGGAMGTELGGLRVEGRPFRVSQFFLAIDVARLMPLAEFEARMDKLIAMVRSTRPAAGFHEVLVA